MDEAEECFSEFLVVARTVMSSCLRGCSTSSACIGGRNRRSPRRVGRSGEAKIPKALRRSTKNSAASGEPTPGESIGQPALHSRIRHRLRDAFRPMTAAGRRPMASG